MVRKVHNIISGTLHIPQKIVDPIGMYRVVTLGLIALVVSSFVASLFDGLAYEITDLTTSLAIALFVGLGFNVLCSLLWKVPANHESAVITSLIVFLLMIPNDAIAQNWPLAAGVALGIVSKYFIAYRRQHILNPAATGMVLVAVGVIVANFMTGSDYSSDIFQWWVANPSLFWVLLVVGSLVTFKIRRWPMVLTCIGVGGMIFMIEWWFLFERIPFESGQIFLTSFPVVFLAFFMLTEPFTTPPTKKLQVFYGGLVGALSSTLLFAQIGFPMTPELALVVGNLLFWPTTLRQKLYLSLIEKNEVAKNTWEFIFEKPEGVTFKAGQYLEWMLPHENADNRGLRRYFTIASAPDEPVVRLAVRFEGEDGSTYKKALMDLDPGDKIIASQLAGDFIWPADEQVKLGLIAGGIGVTPFRSHLEAHRSSAVAASATLYYCNNTLADIAYQEYFDALETNVVHVLAKENREGYETGYLNGDIIKRNTPDYAERTWFISGSPGLVNAASKTLRELGVPKKQIVRDFFPGLA
jgi:ferredoxin-NADP reductase/Na+-translocating ferredoxin:NAD+ oxidoreductase RnfD subunit